MDLSILEHAPYMMDAFRETVAAMPDDIMLMDDPARGWTRARVDEASARVYAYLRDRDIGREDFVLICLPRGVWPMIAMLGVWKAGAAFVVVEDTYAPERIAFIREDCGCKLVLDADALREAQATAPEPGFVRAGDHDAAFAVYTSGSTGNPKGVLHEYGDIKLCALSVDLTKGPDERMACIAPLNFVAAVRLFLRTLYAPYCLCILPYSVIKNPLKLGPYFLEARITCAFFSPSMVRAVSGHFGPYVKTVSMGSESANGIAVDPGITLINSYASSETFFTIAQFVVDRPYDECPVGKPPVPGIVIRLLDESGADIGPGGVGEIALETPFFRGYINLPEQTSQVLRDGWYRTGDLGRFDADGNLIIAGRANDMIKIDGNRIEPAEIETAFKRVTGLNWCAAKGFEKPTQSFLCVYYTEALTMPEDEIRAGMETYLPYYMIPSYFVHIDEAPLLPNGKLSRRDLPDPTESAARAEYVAPRDDLERALCDAFAEVLGLERVGVTEDFYELGGNSVSSMRVLGEMGLDKLSALDIFSARTAERIAAVYRRRMESEGGVSEEEKEMEARKYPQVVTPTQRNVIDIQLVYPHAPIWIYPFMFNFGPGADPERVLDACRKVSLNHPIFATVFGFDRDGELQQRYDPARRAEIEIETMSEAELDAVRQGRIEPFGLVGVPMVRIRVLKADSGTYVLIVFHHLVMDGSSMHIIFTSLSKAYLGQPLELDTYYSYLEDQSRLTTTLAYRQAFDYYHENYDGVDWCANIEPDRHEKGNVNAGVTFRPEGMTPEALTAVSEKCGITRNGFMTAVSLLALSKLSGNTDVITTFAFHDRTDARKMRAGGFLAKTIPVGVRLGQLETLADLYTEIGKRTSEGIANSAYSWDVAHQVQFVNDIMPVAYETSAITDMSWLTDMGAALEPINARHDAALMLTELQILETPADLTFNLFYMATAYLEARIRTFTDAFCALADSMIVIQNPETVTLCELLG